MIDAGPSLRAAQELSATELLEYLVANGWAARPSRVEGILILSKTIPGADRPAEFILPVRPGFDEEHRRVAGALRTIEAVEGRSMLSILGEIRNAAERSTRQVMPVNRSVVGEMRELKYRPLIDDHDYDIKMRAMTRFFEDGAKVKVTLRFRGREMAHQELGTRLLDRIKNDTVNVAKVEKEPLFEGRQVTMVLTPRYGAARVLERSTSENDAGPSDARRGFGHLRRR